jgi:hypothetical protein
MGPGRARSVVLDAGALIGLERGVPKVRALLAEASRVGSTIIVPAGVVAQVWRDGRRQARLAVLLRDPQVVVIQLDHLHARACGELLGRTRRRDVVDASVVISARENDAVIVTSDPDDLRRLDPDARLAVV